MATTAGNAGSLTNLTFENDKKKAAANQTAIEKKRASLDTRHRYLLEKFAVFVDEKASLLENSLLLGNKLDLVNDFLAEGGARKVLFFWQKVSFTKCRKMQDLPRVSRLSLNRTHLLLRTDKKRF